MLFGMSVSLARIYLGAHYLSDCIFGCAYGLLTVTLAAIIYFPSGLHS